jgi:hypothetical protein
MIQKLEFNKVDLKASKFEHYYYKKAILKFYEDAKGEISIDSKKLLEDAVKEIDSANKGIILYIKNESIKI